MILYVSGPMTGIDQFNIPAFDAAQRDLIVAGYDVVSPASVDHDHNPTPDAPQAWAWYMRHALRRLLSADGVALLPGWEDSRGAQVEVYLARELDMPIQRFENWIADMNEPVRLDA